jgi:hypothetical protein
MLVRLGRSNDIRQFQSLIPTEIGDILLASRRPFSRCPRVPHDFIRLLSPFDFGFDAFQKRRERGAIFEFVTDRFAGGLRRRAVNTMVESLDHAIRSSATLLPANDGPLFRRRIWLSSDKLT